MTRISLDKLAQNRQKIYSGIGNIRVIFDSPSDEAEAESIEGMTNALNSKGFGVFRGREFVTIRGNKQIAPNSTVSEQYLDGMSAATLGYDDSTDEIAITPLNRDSGRPDVYSLQWNENKNKVTISASGFLKKHNIDPDQTL